MASYTTNIPVNNVFNVTAVFGQSGSMWKNGHKGVDITADNKTIYSICGGEVTVVGWDADGWGRYVSIKPSGFERIRIILCHLVKDSVKVRVGDKVTRVTKIGTMGTTGNSTGVHVHVEMRVDNTPVDPTPYMLIANKKASGLKDTDYKFNSNDQNAALTAVLAAFDTKNSTEPSHAECEKKIKSLESELAGVKERLAAAESKIENVKKAIA